MVLHFFTPDLCWVKNSTKKFGVCVKFYCLFCSIIFMISVPLWLVFAGPDKETKYFSIGLTSAFKNCFINVNVYRSVNISTIVQVFKAYNLFSWAVSFQKLSDVFLHLGLWSCLVVCGNIWSVFNAGWKVALPIRIGTVYRNLTSQVQFLLVILTGFEDKEYYTSFLLIMFSKNISDVFYVIKMFPNFASGLYKYAKNSSKFCFWSLSESKHNVPSTYMPRFRNWSVLWFRVFLSVFNLNILNILILQSSK